MGLGGCLWKSGKMGCCTIGALWVLGGLTLCTTRNCGGTGNAKEDLFDTPKEAIKEAVDMRGFEDVKTPTGSFNIDFITKKGPNKRYEFTVLGRDDNSQIKVKVREIGARKSELGGTARFNVVFWDQMYPEKQGLGFQVQLNDNGGYAIGPYDGRLKTVIMTDGERTCGKMYGRSTVDFSQVTPDLRRSSTIRRSELIAPEKLMTIPQKLIDQHYKYNAPLMLQPQQPVRRTEYTR